MAGGRVQMRRFGLRFAAQRPVLGYGPGAEDWLIRFQAARWVADPQVHPHSFFVRLLVEGGAALLSAVLVTCGVAIMLLARATLATVDGARVRVGDNGSAAWDERAGQRVDAD